MSVHTLQVKRGNSTISAFEIDESTEFSKTLMGDHVINCQVTLSEVLPIQIGDKIVYKGKNYTINNLPEIQADDSTFQYSITFEPDIYTLYDKKFKHLGAKTFTFFGTLQAHIELIISNISSIDSGWGIGTIDPTEEKFISYDKDDCRTALTKICSPENFNVEYDVDGNIITAKKTIGSQRDLVFKVGKYLGLYNLKRTSVNETGVITRAYGYGGTQNIDYKYRNGTKELVFNELYLEKNVSLYPHVKEGDYVNESIFPQRTGTVTSISTNLATKLYKFTDTSIDFNINEYLQEGIPAKIVFKSGELSGQQMEMENYDHATKTLTYKEFTDTNGYSYPSALYQLAIGNTYTIVDINLPQSYIDVAEAQLKNETQQFLNENSVPQVMYNLEIDEKFIRDNNITLNAGDYITIQDTRLGVNGMLRISAISWPLVNESAIKATISNFILDTTQNQIKSAVLNNRSSIATVYRGNILDSRRQTSNLQALKNYVIDSDGYFDGTHIKPESVETLYLAVGAKSNDFNLSEVVIQANVGGDATKINISGGKLLHNSISITDGFIWTMTGLSQTGLVANTAYYVYAKCSKSTLVGSFVVSATKIKVDDIAGFYHFNLGVLYPEKNGFRDFEFTKGMAYIVGDTLTAGKIKSVDAQTYWDLTQGQFKLGDANAGLDWNVTSPNTLTLRGAIVQSPSGATYNVPVFRGAYSPSIPYYKGDSVTNNGSTWIFISSTPATGQFPMEGVYWTESAKKGSDGTSIAIKGTVANSGALPMTGNSTGDGYITNNDGHLYMWSGSSWTDLGLIRGPAGTNGATGATGATGSPGANGANGLTPYFHIKYSNDGGASFTSSDGETPGDYMGTYTDYVAADSNSPGAYTWVKVKGDQGIVGPAGANGQTLYTWIKYGDSATGSGMSTSPAGKTFIGVAYNKTSQTMSNVASDYTWALYQGPQGVTGPVGANGQPTYTWLKYADNSSGAGLTDDPTGKKYLAIAYNKNTLTESLDPADYSYSLIQGAQGVTARILYTKNQDPDVAPSVDNSANPSGWGNTLPSADDNIYLTDNAGNQIADTFGNLIGVGLLNEYVWMISETITSTGQFVSWSSPIRITGRASDPADYTEVRFAVSGSPTAPPSINLNDSDPAGWTVKAPAFGALEYLWKIYGDKYGKTKALKSSWNGPYRETALDGVNGTNGSNGTNGAQGPSGPLPIGGDVYNSGTVYRGMLNAVSIVRYNDGTGEKAYVARVDAGSFSNVLPTDTSKWNAFGAQYESVATKLFFAQLAYIENLGVKYLKTADLGRRLEINADTNSLKFYNSNGGLAIELLEENGFVKFNVFDVTGNKIYELGQNGAGVAPNPTSPSLFTYNGYSGADLNSARLQATSGNTAPVDIWYNPTVDKYYQLYSGEYPFIFSNVANDGYYVFAENGSVQAQIRLVNGSPASI